MRPDGDPGEILDRALEQGINLRDFADGTIGVSLNEVTRRRRSGRPVRGVQRWGGADIHSALGGRKGWGSCASGVGRPYDAPTSSMRSSISYHSETEMLRYLHKLESRDLSLEHQHDPARVVHDEAQRNE